MGLSTSVFVDGEVPEDLLVFVTGAGNTSVSASYGGKPVDAKQNLRAQSLQVKFSSETDPSDSNKTLAYTITSTDPATAATTVVAKRYFDSLKLNPGVEFQGLQMAFSAVPSAGEELVLDGNRWLPWKKRRWSATRHWPTPTSTTSTRWATSPQPRPLPKQP